VSDTKNRGKTAIGEMHRDSTREDEMRLDLQIADMYEVELVEATEIHANYHTEKIIEILKRRALQNGMSAQRVEEFINMMDVNSLARQIAEGKLSDAGAADILFRGIYSAESNGKDNDRHINFYG